MGRSVVDHRVTIYSAVGSDSTKVRHRFQHSKRVALSPLLLILKRTIKNLAFGIGSTLPLLALVIWGWGDWTTFFSHPARTGVIILALAGAIAYAFSGSSGLGKGRREDPSSRWIFVPLIVIAIVFAWLPPHLDHLDRWTIDGDAVRYTGLIITAIGGFLSGAAVFELGHRLRLFGALQPDHRLNTDGFYRFVRHPSYLGSVLAMACWALVF